MSRNAMTVPQRTRGFTLIEIMVGLAIMAFLLLMAMPSFKVHLLDTKIRGAAQSYYDGAQLARSEALRRNQDVTLTLSGLNRAWDVAQGGNTIYNKSEEAAANLTVQANVTSVTFNGTGEASVANTVQFQSGNTAECIAGNGSQRCLNVIISTGGQVRMCDPTVTEAGDNRKC